MKVKLLKKVRKNFKIIHYPNGVCQDGEIYDYNLYCLKNEMTQYSSNVYVQLGYKENSKKQFCGKDRIFNTERECVNYLKEIIIVRLISEGYRNRRMRLCDKTSKQIWP